MSTALIDQLQILTDQKPLPVLRESYRRIYLGRFIWYSLFSSSSLEEARTAYNHILELSKGNSITFSQQIALLIAEAGCGSNSFLDRNIPNLIVLGYYLVYGNREMEEMSCQDQVSAAQKKAEDIIGRYILHQAGMYQVN